MNNETINQNGVNSKPSNEEISFAELFEKSLKDIKEGQLITGEVVQITRDYVMVDIGYKSEGQIPKEEFLNQDGELNVKVGDKVEVYLETYEDEDGMMILSKEKADKLKIWDDISKACEEGAIVEGEVIQRVKGGLQVDIGVRAFLPGSQVDLRPIRNLEKLVGQKIKCKILKFNKKRGNIVLSRRVILEKERDEARVKTLSMLQEGSIIKGTVKNITEYGVFVDLGGIDGLLHITDISWGRVKHPSELFKLQDEIEVMVLKYDKEAERVSLGLKQMKPDPWATAAEKYPVGSRVKGKVVSITDYGAFVELEEGIEGLIHVSEMSWTKRFRHPSKFAIEGEIIEAVVLDIDPAQRRISLGMKQIEPNPWDIVEQKYPVGTKIRGKIRNITDFGIFIGLDEGIDGLVHISDISWKQRIKNPHEIYKKGDEVEAVVLNIDKENERFSLGIKQLEEDPWKSVPERYKVGDKVEGRVINITEFGVFVELEEGVEGLVHISELTEDKVDDLSKVVNIGQILPTVIIDINPSERKIRLSALKAKEKEESEEEKEEREYIDTEKKTTLGDLLVSSGQLKELEIGEEKKEEQIPTEEEKEGEESQKLEEDSKQTKAGKGKTKKSTKKPKKSEKEPQKEKEQQEEIKKEEDTSEESN